MSEAPSSLRIAVASKDGQRIDQHFGHAEAFWVFDVTAEGATPVEQRVIADHAREGEDARDTVCRMLGDCPMLLVARIGPNPQEKLARAGIEATDMLAGQAIDEALVAVFSGRARALAATAAPVDGSTFRLVHCMLRVADLDRTIAFYTHHLGMQVLERREHRRNQFSQAYLGFGPHCAMSVEFVQNWTRETPYELGDSFGHIALEVTGITALCERLAAAKVPMPRPPRAQRHGESIVAFIEDPDGHRIELIQRAPEE
ncbi:hypothetical protein ROR02_01600 [Pararhodospirillum oryzae]|uniref:Aldoketomutase n=1 Tax=Pararhodospirillum oryzae TaxID=478448 RepID=A0A512H3J4_9PROT|nr:hypothetical protein ROR02_01600 [Pararhodospirillum oryzae]